MGKWRVTVGFKVIQCLRCTVGTSTADIVCAFLTS